MTDTAPATPILKGVYSIYETPGGGYHVAYRVDGTEEDQHIEVPGWIVALAHQKSEGSLTPMALFKGLRGAK